METREKIPAKRLRKKRGVVVNLCNCKYDVVFDCAEKMSWHVIQDEEDEVSWNLYWTGIWVETVSFWSFLFKYQDYPLLIKGKQHVKVKVNVNLRERKTQLMPSCFNVCKNLDTSVSPERVMKMQQFQRINHFPGMINIARKAGLARHLTRFLPSFIFTFWSLFLCCKPQERGGGSKSIILLIFTLKKTTTTKQNEKRVSWRV